MSGAGLTRRRVLQGGSASLVFSLTLLPGGPRPFALSPAAAESDGASLAPNVFVALSEDGGVTITCHRSDMGQHIRTAIAQIIAEELEADWDRITVAQADGDPKYGDQNTDGSRSIRNNFTRLRQAGAVMRVLLEEAAAAQWGVSPDRCRARNHKVELVGEGRSIGYGALVGRATGLELPDAETVALKPREEWRYIRTEMPVVDLDDMVTGKARYGADVSLPGLKVAVIARPPVLFGSVASYDDSAARQVPGVTDIVEMPALTQPPATFRPLGGIAVVADNTWAAKQGRDALQITWEAGPNGEYESGAYREALLAAVRAPADVKRERGDAETALGAAAKVVRAEYYVPHLTQAPMEPPVATAWVREDGVEVWAATQNPQADRQTVAQILGVREDEVTIHVTLLGGGFGRKSKPDFSAEAALLSRAVGGPVRVQWMREDEVRNGIYHGVSAQRLEGGLDGEGRLTAFRHRTAFSSISALFSGRGTPSNGELSLGFLDTPFDVPHLRLEAADMPVHTRVGWMRSVCNIFHAFAVQSFVDEVAQAAGRDPKDFLLELIGPDRFIDIGAETAHYVNYGTSLETFPLDTARLRNVTEIVAERSGWGRALPAGRGLGIAAHRSFVSYMATVVEVEVSDDGTLTIPAAWMALDAGTVVNLDSVRNQCEGGGIYGLACALDAQITFSEGAVEQSNFHDYRVARMNHGPYEIDVTIVDSHAPPAGVGEPPTPPFAPALCNAIFAATGKRIRQLPIGDQLRA